MAFESLSGSEREAEERGKAFADGPADVGPDEIGRIRSCAADVAVIDGELAQARASMHDSGPIPAILDPLEARRRAALTEHRWSRDSMRRRCSISPTTR